MWVVADATIEGSETGTSFKHALHFLNLGLNLHDTMIYVRKHPRQTTPKRYLHAFEYMFVFSNGEPKTANMIIDRPNATVGKSRSSSWGAGRNQNDTMSVRDTSGVDVQKFSKRSNVWEYATGHNHSAPDFPNAHKHPAIFPYKLAVDHVKSWTNENDLIIDPMCGERHDNQGG